jgi:hypothetical protein
MSHDESPGASASRQIQDSSTLATPSALHQFTTNAGQLKDQQPSPAPPPAQPTEFLVDVISSLLATRADAAAIISSVVSRISVEVPGHSLTMGMPGVHPGDPQSFPMATRYARLASMQNALVKWHELAADRRPAVSPTLAAPSAPALAQTQMSSPISCPVCHQLCRHLL